jgi:hypothetical protein
MEGGDDLHKSIVIVLVSIEKLVLIPFCVPQFFSLCVDLTERFELCVEFSDLVRLNFSFLGICSPAPAINVFLIWA